MERETEREPRSARLENLRNTNTNEQQQEGHWSPNTAPTTTARLTPSRIEARGRYYLFYRRESKGLLQETPGIYRAPIMMYYRVTPIASHCCHSDSPARTTPNRHTPTTL
ncbi:unnamed protein product [Arctogadus glacialis]